MICYDDNADLFVYAVLLVPTGTGFRVRCPLALGLGARNRAHMNTFIYIFYVPCVSVLKAC